MKRGIFDILRRGLDNTVANWPLILIKLAAAVLMLIAAVATIFAFVLPVLVSIGIQVDTLETPDEIAGAFQLLAQKWLLLLWILFGVIVLTLLLVAIHSFVEAGVARVYVDGERVGGPAMEGLRGRFGVFSIDRWLSGATRGWWTLFWIYNIAWGVAGLIILIPLLPAIILMLLARESPGAVAAIGCLAVLIALALLIVLGILTTMWTTRAITEWAARNVGVREALADGWRAIRGDAARHLLIALALIVVSMAGSALFSSFSFMISLGEELGDAAIFTLVTIPVQIVAWILSSAVSAAVGSWYTASYAALTTEGGERA